MASIANHSPQQQPQPTVIDDTVLEILEADQLEMDPKGHQQQQQSMKDIQRVQLESSDTVSTTGGSFTEVILGIFSLLYSSGVSVASTLMTVNPETNNALATVTLLLLVINSTVLTFQYLRELIFGTEFILMYVTFSFYAVFTLARVIHDCPSLYMNRPLYYALSTMFVPLTAVGNIDEAMEWVHTSHKYGLLMIIAAWLLSTLTFCFYYCPLCQDMCKNLFKLKITIIVTAIASVGIYFAWNLLATFTMLPASITCLIVLFFGLLSWELYRDMDKSEQQ